MDRGKESPPIPDAAAWHCAMFRPDMFTAVVGLSVPPSPRGPARPLGMMRKMGFERFYWIYFQDPGVAEAEFEAFTNSLEFLSSVLHDKIRVAHRGPLYAGEAAKLVRSGA